MKSTSPEKNDTDHWCWHTTNAYSLRVCPDMEHSVYEAFLNIRKKGREDRKSEKYHEKYTHNKGL